MIILHDSGLAIGTVSQSGVGRASDQLVDSMIAAFVSENVQGAHGGRQSRLE